MELSLEILKEQAPEVLKEIQNEAFKKGYADGINAERARVAELLDADADPVETRKMIDDGVEASEAYKHFYAAEKAKRAQGLKEMESESTESLGTEAFARVRVGIGHTAANADTRRTIAEPFRAWCGGLPRGSLREPT